MTKIGIIGGSGMYSIFDGQDISFKKISTPFGDPSDECALGLLNDKKIIFLPRHGRKHHLLPHEVNYRANIYALKSLGVDKIISVSAVGSLKEEYKPRDVLVVDQFFDRTNKRPQTFFGNGLVAHVEFGDPVCSELREQVINILEQMNICFHKKGTYVNMEGPQFSTRAESLFYKNMGFDVIGMTNLTEARLAREAEICYTTLAFITDYDSWRLEEETVTTDTILAVLRDNAENAKKIISNIIQNIEFNKDCKCQNALSKAMITTKEEIPPETKSNLSAIIKKYMNG